MNAIDIQDSYLVIAMIATAFLAFAAFVTRLVVPIVIREVVPEVVRVVKDIRN
jgi:hypothetical protein